MIGVHSRILYGLLDGPESKHIYIDINHSQVDTPQFLFKSLVVYGSGP